MTEPRRIPAAQRHEEQVRRVMSMYLNQDVKVSVMIVRSMKNADSHVLIHDNNHVT